MKILHLNTYDITGGAAQATYKLHKALIDANIYSRLLVLNKQSPDDTVLQLVPSQKSRWLAKLKNFLINQELKKYGPVYPQIFHSEKSPYNLDESFINNFDIINLHWIPRLINYESFFRFISDGNKKVVWRLADMNPFTGGCHYDWDCGRFALNCGNCPQLKLKRKNDLSEKIMRRKQNIFNSLKPEQMTIVTLSHWMTLNAQKSSLFSRFPIVKIPTGVNLDIFKPYDKEKIKDILEIPKNKFILLLLADDLASPVKGLAHAVEAINLIKNPSDFHLITIGKSKKLPVNITQQNLYYIYDKKILALFYNAADLFIIPSVCENFPNTLLESIACGTPAVGFNIGGIPDIIDDGITGFLAEKVSADTLYDCILKGFENRNNGLLKMKKNCIDKARNDYGIKTQTFKYIQLYKKIIGGIH